MKNDRFSKSSYQSYVLALIICSCQASATHHNESTQPLLASSPEPLTISISTQNTIEQNTQSSGSLIEEKESAHALATDMTIACLYLASSIPQMGPTASTATDIAASALWLGDGLNELRDKSKKKSTSLTNITIASLFLFGGIPTIPEQTRTGATISASLLWLGDSIRRLWRAPKKIGDALTDVTIASLFLAGSMPCIPKEQQTEANIAACAFWLADNSIDLLKICINRKKQQQTLHAVKSIANSSLKNITIETE